MHKLFMGYGLQASYAIIEGVDWCKCACAQLATVDSHYQSSPVTRYVHNWAMYDYVQNWALSSLSTLSHYETYNNT